MIPLHDEDRPRTIPWATLLIIAACGAVFARQLLLPAEAAAPFLETWSLAPSRVAAAPWRAYTLLTSAFLHAGWGHLLFNMLFLWVFGPGIEERVGGVRLLALYAAFAVAAAAAHALVFPASDVPLVGASGAVSGVLGATLVVRPRAELRVAVLAGVVPVGVTRLPAAFMLAVWLLGQIAAALSQVVPGQPSGTAWVAHLGGFAAGALAGVWLRRRGSHTPARFVT